jgi:16S rRNA C1402 (ribose-2'-O) methylase RsmI
MTKVHEEYLRGTAADVFAAVSARKEIIGEFSVFISGYKAN